jgi:DNA-binding phage protein
MDVKRTRKKANRIPAETARLRKLRNRFQAERPSLDQLVKSGQYSPPVKQGDYLAVLELAAQLKQSRQAQRLSLSQVADRTGIDKAALSRIESGRNANPTIGTLETIARAIGARIRFHLEATATAPGLSRT